MNTAMAGDGWDDLLNPFTTLGNAATKVVADAWTVAMLGLWNAGLWLLRLVLGLLDEFLTPDLREDGPLASTYQVTFWVALTLVVALLTVQAGVAAARRDGRAVARMLVGSGQFVMTWATWVSYVVLLVFACSGLTRALMRHGLGVDSWAAWQPWAPVQAEDLTDATLATVLGVLGVLVLLAAIGHLVVLLTRGAALVVLTATAPIAAAGLTSDLGQAWFWKSVRWTHAAAFTPPLMALVLGAGTRLSTAVVTGPDRSLSAAVGSAVPAVLILLVSTVAPLALFKLLAFVDPGTSSGAALRTGMAAVGGVSGLVGAGPTTGGTAAADSDDLGRSAGEGGGEAATTTRFTQSAGSLLGTVGGALGQGGGRALSTVVALGATGAAIGADAANQMGVGHSSYVPDFTTGPRRTGGSTGQVPEARGEGPTVAPDPAPSTPSLPGAGPAPAPAGAGGAVPAAGAAGGGAAAGAGAAAAVPVVPV